MNCLALYCYKLVTHEITSTQYSKILTINECWPPQIIMIPQYHSFIKVTSKKPFFAFGQIQNVARLSQVKEGEI